MTVRFTAVAAAALLVAACTAPSPTVAPAPATAVPGSIVYSDTWRPGWALDPEDGRYYIVAQ